MIDRLVILKGETSKNYFEVFFVHADEPFIFIFKDRSKFYQASLGAKAEAVGLK